VITAIIVLIYLVLTLLKTVLVLFPSNFGLDKSLWHG